MTEMVFIIDKSGSMAGMEKDTVGGFNAAVAKQKKCTGSALVSLVLFSGRSEVVYDRVDIDSVPALTEDDYLPGGSTALLDAVGDAVRHISNVHKYARSEDRPSKTVFVIITDGLENTSSRYTYRDIKSLIDRQKEACGWEFLFLGANIDSEREADRLGISRERAVNYHCDNVGTKAVYESVAEFCCEVQSGKVTSDGWRKKADADYSGRKNKK